MKISRVPFVIAFFSLLASCATIVSGTSQVIKVQAIDRNTQEVIPYAKCTITNAKGVVFPVYGNPGSVNVPREYGGLQASCTAKGYLQSGVGAGESFNAWTLVDVVFWPSFFVDAATGAAKKYPSYITVLMQSK
jgi:hypothetical protein